MQNFFGPALCGELSLFEEEAVIRDVLNQTEIVSRSNDRFPSITPSDQQINNLALASRVERGGWLVEQKNLGIKHQNRGEGDSFFLSAGEAMRGAMPEMSDLHKLQHRFDAPLDLIPRPFQLQRPEGDFIKNGRIEELHVGILKDQPNAPAEAVGESVPGQFLS